MLIDQKGNMVVDAPLADVNISADGWELALDVKALAQSVMGRSISNSYILHIKGDDMRKYYNCKP